MKTIKTATGIIKYIGVIAVYFNPRNKTVKIVGMHKPFKCSIKLAKKIADNPNEIDFSVVEIAHREGKKEIRRIRSNLYYNNGVNCCYVCDQYMRFEEATLEHIIPISKGGATRYENYSLSHFKCNVEKSDSL